MLPGPNPPRANVTCRDLRGRPYTTTLSNVRSNVRGRYYRREGGFFFLEPHVPVQGGVRLAVTWGGAARDPRAGLLPHDSSVRRATGAQTLDPTVTP
eukprot:2835703-Rhodomonas_salina.2